MARLRLHVTNLSAARLALRLDTSAGAEAAADAPPRPPAGCGAAWSSLPPCDAYAWCGAVAVVPQLGPGESAVVALRVLLFAPGLVSVGGYRLLWSVVGGGLGGAEGPMKANGSIAGRPAHISVRQAPA